MKKRLKKKNSAYRLLTSKQRLKNQAKTIRQLTIENRDLKIKRENETRTEISKLQAQLAYAKLPWWKKVLKCK